MELGTEKLQLSETDLGIHVEADFGEAARKAVELANQDS